jgi:uncharacterized protein
VLLLQKNIKIKQIIIFNYFKYINQFTGKYVFFNYLLLVFKKKLTNYIQKMNLEEQINTDIKTAMLARDAAKLEALRAVKSTILLLKTSADGTAPDAELKALLKMVKQRKETAVIYVEQNRQDMADVELAQAAVIENYLPKQLNEEEITAELKTLIAQIGATSITDLGKVMGLATKAFAGRADGKIVASLVKALLS